MLKRKRGTSVHSLDGVATFFGAHHALRAEAFLKKNGLPVRLVPGPRDISPNCGVALRFDFARRELVESLFSRHAVQFEAIHHLPEED